MVWQEDDFIANKRTWFDTQVRVTFLWSWIMSRALVDYTDIGRIIGCILDDVQAPYVSMNDSVRNIISYFHTSMVVHPGSYDHFWIHNLIHGNMLSSSSKKQMNGIVSLKNYIQGVDYKMTINMLLKHLYLAVQYFYITNRLISGYISSDIYKPTKIMKINYFIQVIQGKLININKLELTKMNVIKTIISKGVRL